jgi:putative membrane protein
MKIFIRWLIIALSLFVAVWVVPGIHVADTNAWIAFAVMAAVLGLVNALIKPILKFLSCGFIALTFGLFIFIINAFTLWLSSWIAINWLDVGFYVDSFLAALLGSIIVSIVSFVMDFLVPDNN